MSGTSGASKFDLSPIKDAWPSPEVEPFLVQLVVMLSAERNEVCELLLS